MNFATTEFLFLFFPIVLIAFHLAPRVFRLPVMLSGSLFFYWVSGDMAVALLVVTIAWVAVAAFVVARYRSLFILSAAISVPLLFLFLFKYLGFSLDVFGVSGEARSHFNFILVYVLPAGISFYTFQAVSYLIDVRDGVVAPERNPVKFATFVSFFPQLIAGPILRFDQISAQLSRVATVTRLRPDWRSAIKFVTWGLAYKIFFADVLRAWHEQHDLAVGGGTDALYSVLAYSLIIYFDFWSYSLMAIGLAKLFTIDLPRNFYEPYKAPNPREFWRRWHVTLSFWLRDYVYLRLGGNRRYVANIIIVFLACGIWHGAGWSFLIWGAYHAALVVGYHWTRQFWDRTGRPVQVFVTFVLVTIGWPLFYLDVDGFVATMQAIVTMPAAKDAALFGGTAWAYLAVVGIWTFGFREDRWLFNTNRHWLTDNPVLLAVVLSVSILFLYFGRTFIYFNF